VHVKSKNADSKPDVQIHHFSTDNEIQTMLRGVRIMETILKSKFMKDYVKYHVPLDLCTRDNKPG